MGLRSFRAQSLRKGRADQGDFAITRPPRRFAARDASDYIETRPAKPN
jgi:hypothetical protein